MGKEEWRDSDNDLTNNHLEVNNNPILKNVPNLANNKDIVIAEDDEYEYLYADPNEDYDDEEYELVYLDENGNILKVVDEKNGDISKFPKDMQVDISAYNNMVKRENEKIISENFDYDKVVTDIVDDVKAVVLQEEQEADLKKSSFDETKKINDRYIDAKFQKAGRGNVRDNKELLENIQPQVVNRRPKNPNGQRNNARNNNARQQYIKAQKDKNKNRLSIDTRINIVGILTILTLLVTTIILVSYAIVNNSNDRSVKDRDVADRTEKKDDSLENADEITSDEESKTAVTKDYMSMIFGGDVLLSESMVSNYRRNNGDITNIMAENLLKEFLEADVAMVNEEFPFSTRGTKMQNKQYTFRTNPQYISIFGEMGVDVVSLANNHILDYDRDALLDTLTTLNAADIKYVGAGANLSEAKEAKYFTKNDIDVAILSASRVIPVASWNATDSTPGVFTTYDSTQLVNEIKNVETKADFVVVYVHWGVENEEYPQDYQKNLAYQYIDAGADLVIGCHTHCLQGMEYYNGKPIVYSMGNFMFGNEIDKTIALQVEVYKDNSTKIRVLPCNSKMYCTSIVEDASKRSSFFDYYKGISYNIQFDDNGNVKR